MRKKFCCLRSLLLPCILIVFCMPVPAADAQIRSLPVNGNVALDDMRLPAEMIEMDGIAWNLSGKKTAGAMSYGDKRGPSPAIPVESAPDRLHFLHTLIYEDGLESLQKGYAETGRLPAHPPQVFGYELLYEDGTKWVLHIDWMHHVGVLNSEKHAARLYNAVPVVLGEGDSRHVLYHCMLPNPLPGRTITSIRIIAPEKGENMGKPLLLGLALEDVEPVQAFGHKWGCNDYSYLYGATHVAAEGESLKIPMQNKSDRAALAYIDETVEGDFSVRMRLADISRYANWASVGLSATPAVIFTGRGGTQDNIALYFKPFIEPGRKKDGIFALSGDGPVRGGFVLEQGKPPVKLADAQYNVALPVWMRLDREGDRFTAYRSLDGEKWEKVGQKEGAEMPASLYISIFTCLSHSPKVEYATIESFSLQK